MVSLCVCLRLCVNRWIDARVYQSVGPSVDAIEAPSLTQPNQPKQVWKMDLADLSSVKDFAERFLASGRPLHVLMNNAGLVSWEHVTTKDGHELTYQVMLEVEYQSPTDSLRPR